jgi:O-antigen/teichoic acid export membrane protein
LIVGGPRRTFLAFALSVAAMNAASLLGNALAFRWVDPVSMGVWQTLLLAASYLTVVRLGIVNGLGRELPYALGAGDVDEARRMAATALAFNAGGSALVAVAFLAPLPSLWLSGPAWRVGLPAMAMVSAASLYLAYLQATFRSDRDFGRLAWVHAVQAGTSLLLPLFVYRFGFTGLCFHAAAQAAVVTGFAHAVRPLKVSFAFDPALARQMLATGLPLFAASYLQTLAMGFDRVILLHRGGLPAVGYYAPALAVLAASAVVPGAVATWVYPRMSYAIGQGQPRRAARRMAFVAAATSVAAGLPLAVAAGAVAAPLISRFLPQYEPSIPAVRWSLGAGLLWCLSPAATLLGSLKEWRSLAVYIGVVLVARWAFPWLLSAVYEPREGVARGNLLAAAVTGAVLLGLVHRATAEEPEGARA